MRIRQLERLLEEELCDARNPQDRIQLVKIVARLRIAELQWRKLKLRSKLAAKHHPETGPK